MKSFRKFKQAWMRIIFAALVAVLPPRVALADDIDNLFSVCGAADAACQSSQSQFRDDWLKANKGDYAAQRNVAFCLSRGCDGAVRIDQVAGCAWRVVIVMSPAAYDSGDVMNFQMECRGLRSQSLTMARLLFSRIYHRPMDDLP